MTYQITYCSSRRVGHQNIIDSWSSLLVEWCFLILIMQRLLTDYFAFRRELWWQVVFHTKAAAHSTCKRIDSQRSLTVHMCAHLYIYKTTIWICWVPKSVSIIVWAWQVSLFDTNSNSSQFKRLGWDTHGQPTNFSLSTLKEWNVRNEIFYVVLQRVIGTSISNNLAANLLVT